MNTKLLLTIGFCTILMACSKGKMNTRPTIEEASLSSKDIPVNGGLRISLKYTDKEGDISDTIYIRKYRLNAKKVPTVRDSFRFQIPPAPFHSVGFIDIDLSYINLQSGNAQTSTPENDTLLIKLNMKDKANNVSDTFPLPVIVVRRQ